MIQLCYCSTSALDDVSSGFFVEIGRIIERSLINNGRANITGVLAASGRRFVQILEGPPADVDALFHRIADDTRHSAVRIVMCQEVAERSFGSWSMAYAGRASDAGRIMHALADGNRSAASYQALVAAIAGSLA